METIQSVACLRLDRNSGCSNVLELPAFWFVVEKSGNPKALQVSHLQAAPPSKILPQLVHKLVHK